MKDCYIVIPVFTDPFLHPLHKNNKLSFLYTKEIGFNPHKFGETRIISELNPDCTEMCEDYSFLSKKEGLIITLDSKILQSILPEYRNCLDVNHAHWWIYNKPLDLDIRNNAIDFLSNKYYNVKKLNEIIPLSKHKEYCNEVCERIGDFLFKNLGQLMKDDSWFYNGNIEPLQAFSNIEKQGIKVSDDVCDIFDIRVKKHISDGKLYSQYNLLTTTGRPSNSFGTVNFAALPPEKRKAIVPENDSLVEFDFDAYHLRLIANLINYDFGGESVHEHFAKIYDCEYDEAKQKTFQILYGGIRDEHRHLSQFFNKTYVYINKKWNEINTHNLVHTDIYRRKLLFKNYEDLNRNKLFNYLIQAYETEMNIKKILSIQDYLLKKKTKLVLYGYDSFLFDFANEDGVETLREIKKILEDKICWLPINRVEPPVEPYFMTKSKMGLNYGEMEDITKRL